VASTLKQFKAHALARPKVKKAYDDLAEEFALLDQGLKARAESGLSQAEVAAGVSHRRAHGPEVSPRHRRHQIRRP